MGQAKMLKNRATSPVSKQIKQLEPKAIFVRPNEFIKILFEQYATGIPGYKFLHFQKVTFLKIWYPSCGYSLP